MEADSLISVFFFFSASDRNGKGRDWNRSRDALCSINSRFYLLVLQEIKDVS